MNGELTQEELHRRLAAQGYIAESPLVASLLMMDWLGRPLLVEGNAGVGKTEIAKVLASVYGCELIRLQCYEGIDASTAIYEWNYPRQLLNIRLHEGQAGGARLAEPELFSETFLLRRPLLEAISREQAPVLLVDEVDRADEEFEAFLLELLSDFQVSIPELGTIKARSRPRVVLTSNGTRELSDALRRRCLYYYVDYPDFDKELRILQTRLPGLQQRLAEQVVSFVQRLRAEGLRKAPGVAETLDWAATLMHLQLESLGENPACILDTLACLLKTREDQAAMSRERTEMLLAEAL